MLMETKPRAIFHANSLSFMANYPTDTAMFLQASTPRHALFSSTKTKQVGAPTATHARPHNRRMAIVGHGRSQPRDFLEKPTTMEAQSSSTQSRSLPQVNSFSLPLLFLPLGNLSLFTLLSDHFLSLSVLCRCADHHRPLPSSPPIKPLPYLSVTIYSRLDIFEEISEKLSCLDDIDGSAEDQY